MTRTLAARHDCFALARPFRISRGVRSETNVVTVAIAQDGVTGRGEGVPYPRYGEDVENTLAAIEAARGAIENGVTRADLLDVMHPGAARNAVDCALWDLEARLAGTSVAAMIGAPAPTRLASALTIGIDTPEAMATATAEAARAPLLKVKVNAEDPEGQLRAVRGVAPDARLIVDPNESWDEALMRAIQPLLVQLKVDLLEQPVSAKADEWLEGFRGPIPIAADEAVHIAADLDVVARRYQVVNVKLDKSGGLTAALELAHATRARGLGLMTGCMVCSSLSIAASLHVARMSDFADLDGPLWLREDYPGGVTDDAGMMSPPTSGFWGETA